MIYPDAIYRYEQSESDSRFNLTNNVGEDIPEIYYKLVRGKSAGIKCIRVGKPKKKKGSHEERTEIALSNPRIGNVHPELIKIDPVTKTGKPISSVSNIYEPDPERAGEGYGDIRGTEDAFLSIRDDKAGTLKIMVFRGMKKQKKALFLAWEAGGISEAISNNKVHLTPLSDIAANQ